MICLTKKSILHTVLAASLGAVCASAASEAGAATYLISLTEDTFGPAGQLPYDNGIIQKYSTNLYGPTNVPQSAAYHYTAAKNEVNGIAGDYNVSAEASPAHGGTAHAYAFGDGGFSGNSTSRNAEGIKDPQQGYTAATATVNYGFRVVGPSSATLVPVTFVATAYVKTVGTGYGSADLLIYSDPLAPLVDWELGGEQSDETGAGGETIYLSPNTLYAVLVLTTAYGHSPYEDGPYDPTQDSGSADAYVDPTFALSGQYASLYHFEGLPDVALAGGVPEPSTWAMLLIGFAAAGLLYRRNARSALA